MRGRGVTLGHMRVGLQWNRPSAALLRDGSPQQAQASEQHREAERQPFPKDRECWTSARHSFGIGKRRVFKCTLNV